MTRARAKSKPQVTREPRERVEIIADMMRRLEWRRGVSGPLLAKEWGLALKTVEGNATEASRVVAREVTDPEGMKVEVASVLRENLQRASEDRQYKAVASLGDVVTRIIGARAPEKHVVELTEEQARAKYRELTGRDWGESKAGD